MPARQALSIRGLQKYRNIVVLAPEEFKKDFLANVKQWAKRHSRCKALAET